MDEKCLKKMVEFFTDRDRECLEAIEEGHLAKALNAQGAMLGSACCYYIAGGTEFMFGQMQYKVLHVGKKMANIGETDEG